MRSHRSPRLANRRGRAGRRSERGATLVLAGMLQVALLTVAALVVDIGAARASAHRNQSLADLSALSAGDNLAIGDYTGACRALVTSLAINEPKLSVIDASSFCGQSGNDVSKTVCSIGGLGLGQARPKITVSTFTVEVHFPVPLSEIWDSRYGQGLNDGLLCQRMKVSVTSREPTSFGRVIGSKQLTVTRSATVRAKNDPRERIPALWLLDPFGCTALSASGGSQVTVGIDSANPGIIKLDSDGSACSSNQDTISSAGSNTLIKAYPSSGSPKGAISLYALPPGATSCFGTACDPDDVLNGRIDPQPQGSDLRATRAPADWRFNCKSTYPSYHGLPIAGCTDGKPAYLTNLKNAIGSSGNPSSGTYQRWTTSYSCNPAGTVTVSGNWWIDCNNGLSIGNGTTVTFLGGNLVFDDGLSMTGGQLNINTDNPTDHLPSSCLPPSVSTPCLDSSSKQAAFVWVRDGNWDLTGGQLNINQTAVYQEDGYVKAAAAAPNWSAPTEGPLKQLSLWSEASSNKFQINGGAGIQLSGVFFTPEANPLTLNGGGNWGQLSAQFISYHVAISGGGTLTMAPSSDMISLPTSSNRLIR